jgi:transposase
MAKPIHSSTGVPPVPQDTARAAMGDYSPESPYIRFGDALDELVRDLLNETALESPSDRTSIPTYVYAILTYFQFLEQVTDEHMVETVRRRADLRYAIHWHMGFPNIPTSTLCEFRRWLYTHPSFHETFITLVNRSAELVLPEAKPCQPDIAHILKSICAVTRVEKAKDVMLQAIETLSAEAPGWIRTIAPPHWYDRYSRLPRNIFSANVKKDWLNLLPDIEYDIRLLLDALVQKQDERLSTLPEIKELQALWEEQFANPQKKECLLCSRPKP